MKKDTRTGSLFDMAPLPEPEPVVRTLTPELQATCLHDKEVKTETIWPDRPGDPRLTWTCITCGRYRGRCP